MIDWVTNSQRAPRRFGAAACIGAIAIFAAMPACGNGGGSTAGLGPIEVTEDRVLFDPLGGELRPFPSDLYLVADATRPSGARMDVWTQHLPAFVGLGEDEEMDGFDPNGRMMLAVEPAPGRLDGVRIDPHQDPTGLLDPATFPDPEASADLASSILLVVADPSAPDFGVPIPFVARVEPVALRQPSPAHLLSIRPQAPLATHTRYALIVTRRLAFLDTDGSQQPIGPSSTLADLLEGRASGESRLDDYAALLRATISSLEKPLALSPQDVAAITVFTTATEEALTSRLEQLIDAATRTTAQSPPRFVVDSIEEHDRDVRVRGRMRAHEYRRANETLDPSRFASVPVTAPEVELEVLVTLPRTPAAGGAPMVLFGHGINDSKEALRAVSPDFADRGLAGIAIDMPDHGSRFPGGTIPALAFLSLDHLPSLSGNARQTAADFAELAALARTGVAGLDVLPLGAPDGVPDVDGSRLAYLGVSFGAILGSLTTATVPDIQAAALIVGGGPWTDIALGYASLTSPAYDFLGSLTGLIGLAASDELTLIAVSQQVVAPSDPLTFARHTLRDPLPLAGAPRSVLAVEVIGDEVVVDSSGEALARTLGVPQLVPAERPVPGLVAEPYPAHGNGPAGTTAGLVQYATFADGSRATHSGVYGAPEVRAQAADFLAAALRGEVPTIERAGAAVATSTTGSPSR